MERGGVRRGGLCIQEGRSIRGIASNRRQIIYYLPHTKNIRFLLGELGVEARKLSRTTTEEYNRKFHNIVRYS
jgi:hypothetical protein